MPCASRMTLWLCCLSLSGLWPAVSNSQRPLENTLLWEIIHPVTQKTSYLFATVHRNDSLLLQVDAKIPGCLKRCDVLALESDPSQWQTEYTKDPLLEFGWPTNQGPAISYLHPADFQLPEYRNAILQALTQIPSFAANWMRYSHDRAVPALDILLYQTAVRLQKPVVELESDNDRQGINAPTPSSPSKNLPLSDNPNQGALEGPWDQSYRQGNLHGFTAVEQPLVAENDAPRLIKRNQLFLQHIRQVLRRQSAFIAIGAAHIPGKHGLLAQLRAAGFRIKPLAFQRQISLLDASKTIPLPITTDSLFQYHEEGFELRSPNRLYYANSYPLFPLKQYTELATGQIFVAGRIATAARFRGLKPADILQQAKLSLQALPNVKLRYASDTLVDTLPAWHIVVENESGLWQEQLLIVGWDCCWIVGWHGTAQDRQRARTFFAGFARLDKSNQPPTWMQFQSSGAQGAASIGHQVTSQALGTTTWRIRHTLPEYRQLSTDSLQLRLAETGWRKSADIATAGTPRFTQYRNHLVLENTYQSSTGLSWKARFLRTGPTIWAWITEAYNVEDVAAFDGFPRRVFLAPQILQWHTDSTLGFRMKLVSIASTATQAEHAKQTLSAGGTVFRQFNLLPDHHIQLQVVPLDAYQQWSDSAAFLQRETERLQQQRTLNIQLIESSAHPQNHQWKINFLVTQAGSNNAIYHTVWLSGRRIYRLSLNYDTLLYKAPALFTAFHSFEPMPSKAAQNTVFNKEHTLYWADYFSSNVARSSAARPLLAYMSFLPGDLPYLERAWKQASSKFAYAADRSSLIYQITRLGATNDQPANLLAKWFHTGNNNDTLRSAMLLELARLATPTASDWLWKLDSSLHPPLTGEYASIDWANYLQTGLPHRLRYLPQIRNEILTNGGRPATWKLLYQLHDAGLLPTADLAILEPAIQQRLDSVWKQLQPKLTRRSTRVRLIAQWFHRANFSNLANLVAHGPNATRFMDRWMNNLDARDAWWAQVYYWPARWKALKQINTKEWDTLLQFTPGRILLEEQAAKSQGQWRQANNDAEVRDQGKWMIQAFLAPNQTIEPNWVKDTAIVGLQGAEHWLVYTVTQPGTQETMYALTRTYDSFTTWMDHNVYLLPKSEASSDALLNEALDRITAASQPQLRFFLDPEAFRAGSWAN